MQIQIEQGHEIRMLQNQLEERLEQAIKNDSQLQQKLQQYYELVQKVKDLNYCSKQKIQNSNAVEEMAKKLQDHLIYIQKQRSEIEEFKNQQIENITQIQYDFVLERMQNLEKSHKDVLQDLFEQYTEQRDELNQIQIQKSEEEQLCLQEYVKLSNINRKEAEKIRAQKAINQREQQKSVRDRIIGIARKFTFIRI
ncbi:hypothetical protein TTHERM_00051920 (macronuclear) [Tetrahymena thermophila SB210]|uniref:Uncharacterized protein n=1 Tax=Tetrahymena thermophila (strain SB210) TaxID=312017 RepID=Q23CZ7_TETTS|nr:hypothetical protein TTHERM_00051920 [Tetrahymena thermophila SB210]EAR94639.2 hypothetical protein TTHERM_00051920 [Tetrahymena thermophila SB210]|eukprot:XP_001014889.2 hypothetical protein TTHERM_00051920 [Tetrahymena thermophila SB210]